MLQTAWLTRSMRPSGEVMTLPIGASSNATRSRSARSRCPVTSWMEPIVNVRPSICIRLMPSTIGKDEPSLRRPVASPWSPGPTIASNRRPIISVSSP